MPTIQTIHQLINWWKQTIQDYIDQQVNLAVENKHNSIISVVHPEESIIQSLQHKVGKWEQLQWVAWICFGVKDLINVQWTLTTCGSALLSNYQSPYTATVAQRLLDAWAILIAKENLDQFGHGSRSDNSAFWDVVNAHDDELVAGWSSGWSAVNVASWVTAFSIWTDTGWSVRQPAWYNKVVGFKPSYGTISRYWIQWYAPSLDTVWIIANNVQDIVTVLNVVAWRDPHDMTTIDYQPIKTEQRSKQISTVRIWYYKTMVESDKLNHEIKQWILQILDQLKQLWHTIVELDWFDPELLVGCYYTIAMAETGSELNRFDWTHYGNRVSGSDQIHTSINTRTQWFSVQTQQRILWWNMILSKWVWAEYYHHALGIREEIIEQTAQDFEKVDFVLSPVGPTLPPRRDEIHDAMETYLSDLFTVWFSLSKIPTICIPRSTPIGIQISSAYWTDDKLLQFADYLYSTLD